MFLLHRVLRVILHRVMWFRFVNSNFNLFFLTPSSNFSRRVYKGIQVIFREPTTMRQVENNVLGVCISRSEI